MIICLDTLADRHTFTHTHAHSYTRASTSYLAPSRDGVPLKAWRHIKAQKLFQVAL